jgi:hypothetical protein
VNGHPGSAGKRWLTGATEWPPFCAPERMGASSLDAAHNESLFARTHSDLNRSV